jgi:DNA-binding SARP family transcriptional activator/pimeloyl-ACP methyl ester carboxylesterase
VATVAITLLGTFSVSVDGRVVDAVRWRRRSAADLVKLLALAPDRRLHREQVIDALWPELTVADAAPRLHKAAHFARQALGHGAVSTRGEVVQLFPGQTVDVDVVAFEAAAAAALDGGSDPSAALDRYSGDLLPDDRYEAWAQPRRDHLVHVHRQLLRAAGRWTDLLALDPADESAHVGLMRSLVERGDGAAARAEYERMARVLRAELGVEPGDEARAVVAAAEALVAAPPAAADESATLPPQEIRFCHAAGGVRLAYAVVGSGRPLVKTANWLSHLEYDWDSAIWRHWLLALTSRFRLLRYDERGCGLSDWNTTAFTLDAWVDDLETVVDSAGFTRFALLGVSQGAAVAVEYAARHPERVESLVLYGSYVHGAAGRTVSPDERRVAELLPELAEAAWGADEPAFRQIFTSRFIPGGTRRQWDEFNELQRRSTSPTNAARFMRGFAVIDVADAAQRVRCPTLVVHARRDHGPPLEEGRLLASLIPEGRFVSLDGENHLLLADEPAWPRFLQELDRFLAEVTG